MRSRYKLWKDLGRPEDHFVLWNREKLTEWAREHGYKADLSFCEGAPGVVKQTQAEANRSALAQLGHNHYDAWLVAITNTGREGS